ncbi:MAG: hypothetical protein EBX52_13740 [Proteobacteria bacterium]|nr:hypothetical protein [Pseudomonadota bacterium]
MSDQDQPRKIDSSQVEVIGSSGEVLKEAAAEAPVNGTEGSGFARWGGVRVIRGGPALLLLLPILIPVAMILLFLMAIAAIFFGRSMVRIFSTQLKRR